MQNLCIIYDIGFYAFLSLPHPHPYHTSCEWPLPLSAFRELSQAIELYRSLSNRTDDLTGLPSAASTLSSSAGTICDEYVLEYTVQCTVPGQYSIQIHCIIVFSGPSHQIRANRLRKWAWTPYHPYPPADISASSACKMIFCSVDLLLSTVEACTGQLLWLRTLVNSFTQDLQVNASIDNYSQKYLLNTYALHSILFSIKFSIK